MQLLPGRHHAMFKEIEDIKAFILKKIKEHEQNLDLSDPKDFIDCFSIKLKQVSKDFLIFLCLLFKLLPIIQQSIPFILCYFML